eukprot:scaffold124658_cov52-Attheya_sp.AAC.1
MKPGRLLYAAVWGEVECMRKLLDGARNLNASDIDDTDANGKTTMMAAARGQGRGGEAYSKIIHMLLAAYSQTGACLKTVLLKTDGRLNWTVLMHSAKCGDIDNLNLVLDLYAEHVGSLPEIEHLIDLVHVDHKVKGLISERVFSGDAVGISNYGRTSRRTRKKSQGLAVSTQASTKLSTKRLAKRTTSSNSSSKRKSSSIGSSHQRIQKKAKESNTKSTAATISSTESSRDTMHDKIKPNSNLTSPKTNIMIDCEEKEEDLLDRAFGYDDETVNLEGRNNPTAETVENAAGADDEYGNDEDKAISSGDTTLRIENARLHQEIEKLKKAIIVLMK